ncbi:SusC/RagA family TonB-linked outer membrane protein [Aquirufa sp. ROCK2-A2]
MKKQLLSKVLSSIFFILIGFQIFAQDRMVTGRVTASDDGSGIPGATVSVKGTSKGTSSDANGNYKISVSSNAVLVFSSVGYNNQEVTVGSKTQINISLAADTKDLTEVIVVGYGTQKKSQTTGAISSVTSKMITEMPITNLGQAMQGRVAGVDVAQSGSKPGTVPKVLIRGRRSFNAGNDPLYVVDGIPLSGGYEDMNPNDVASMEILKDATATAIYGARGANGVVLITTKRGAKDGKTVISYDTYVGSTQTLDKINLFTGAEYAEMKRESRRSLPNGGTYRDANGNPVPTGVIDAYADSKLFTAVELEGIKLNRTTDYQDMMVKKGIQQNHALGIQGGNDKTQFSINAGYFQDKGIIEGLDFTRYSLRASIDHQVNKRLKIGASTYFMNAITNGANLNPYGYLLSQNPLARSHDDSGNLIFQQTDDALLTNPLNEIVPGAKIDETKKYRIFNSIYAEYQIADGLKYRVNFGPDFTISRNGRFNGALTNDIKGGNPTASTDNRFGFNFTLENILTYNKQFKDHNLGVTLLQSMQRDNFEQYTQSVLGVPVETQAFYNVGNASSIQGVGSNLIQWTIASYMARVNYDYKGKYLITATMRRDGSSRFGENSKWGNFPGVALGWNLHQENFMKDLTWLDELKLRASFAQVGNQGLSPYQTQGLESRTSYAWNTNAAYGYRPNTLGNADLKWETSTSQNLGADFSIFRGRIAGSIEYYQTNTTDLLLSDQLPTSTGFAAVTRNVGETQNKGVEISLSTVNVDSESGFKWSTDFTFYKNTEAILSLYNGAKDDVGNKWFIGQPLSAYFDYKYAGIWQASEAAQAKALGFSVGQIKVADTNVDGKISADDRVLLGSDVPSWTGGITNRFSYKGFDLSFFIFTRQGQQIVSRFHQNSNYLQGRYNQIKVDYYTPNNPNAYYPRPNFNQEFPAYNTAIMYFDGSFIKVRNINIGYTFPGKTAAKLGLSSLRVYASIQQPFIFSDYRSKQNGVDPETSNGNVDNNVTPATSVSTFGLNIKF